MSERVNVGQKDHRGALKIGVYIYFLSKIHLRPLSGNHIKGNILEDLSRFNENLCMLRKNVFDGNSVKKKLETLSPLFTVPNPYFTFISTFFPYIYFLIYIYP